MALEVYGKQDEPRNTFGESKLLLVLLWRALLNDSRLEGASNKYNPKGPSTPPFRRCELGWFWGVLDPFSGGTYWTLRAIYFRSCRFCSYLLLRSSPCLAYVLPLVLYVPLHLKNSGIAYVPLVLASYTPNN